MRAFGEAQLRQPTGDLAAIISRLINSDWPACELRLVAFAHVAKTRPTLEGDLPILLVKSRDAKAVSAFLFVGAIFRIGVGHHGNLVA